MNKQTADKNQTNPQPHHQRKQRRRLPSWVRDFLIPLLIVLFIRGFIGAPSWIPTTSMEKTLMAKELVLVSKLNYGPRIPMTWLVVPLTHREIPLLGIRSYLEWPQLPYMRLPGWEQPHYNDIIVFNYPAEFDYPVDRRLYYVKRCVGLPGDTLHIQRGKVYVNGKEIPPPPDAEFAYCVQLRHGTSLQTKYLRRLGVYIYEYARLTPNLYILYITEAEAQKLRSFPAVRYLQKMEGRQAHPDTPYQICAYHLYSMFPGKEPLFPKHPAYAHWTIDDMGPIYIPKAGDTLWLTIPNVFLYRTLITEHEGHDLVVTPDGKIFIDGKPAQWFIPKMNYYWAMGDNRHNSQDSRYWGFVPENHLVGKVVMTLFSWDPHGKGIHHIRWDRFFRTY